MTPLSFIFRGNRSPTVVAEPHLGEATAAKRRGGVWAIPHNSRLTEFNVGTSRFTTDEQQPAPDLASTTEPPPAEGCPVPPSFEASK